MITVEITGFKSVEDAEEFINWYQGAGEQDSEIWQQEHSPEGNWYGLNLKIK
jgi:hypothetical protein